MEWLVWFLIAARIVSVLLPWVLAGVAALLLLAMLGPLPPLFALGAFICLTIVAGRRIRDFLRGDGSRADPRHRDWPPEQGRRGDPYGWRRDRRRR